MKKSLLGSFLLLFTTFSFAQTLNEAIKTQAQIWVNHLNLVSEREYELEEDSEWDYVYKYHLANKVVVMSDLNGDGDQDAVVLAEYCEKTSCHLTTTTMELMIFQGRPNNQFVHVETKSLPGVGATVKVYPSKLIEVKCTSFSETDAHCCPSEEIIKRYRLNAGKLYSVR